MAEIHNQKICSWDVGIEHLAYCVMQKNMDPNPQNKYIISKWNIIDLMPITEVTGLKCCIKNKKADKECTNNPIYCVYRNNEYVGFCGTHVKQIEDVASFKECKKEDEHVCCNVSKSNKICGKKAKYGKNNNYYCKPHKLILEKEENKPQKIKKLKCRKIRVEELRVNMFKILDNIPEIFAADEIIIENQPTLKNPKMKAMADALFDYYVIKGIMLKIHNSNIKDVKLICPSNKLKVNEDNSVEILARTTDEKKYKVTKQLSVKYCKQLIQNDKANLDHFLSFKKNDDLADCFLQGCYYLDILKIKRKEKKICELL